MVSYDLIAHKKIIVSAYKAEMDTISKLSVL